MSGSIFRKSRSMADTPILVSLCVGYISMIFHELGHAATALLVGSKVTLLEFGKPTIPYSFKVGSVHIRVGLPFGGRCWYESPVLDRTTPYRSALIGIGGWLGDTTILFLMSVVYSSESRSDGVLYLVTLYLWFKVIFGITPLTGDGRDLLYDIRMMWAIRRENT